MTDTGLFPEGPMFEPFSDPPKSLPSEIDGQRRGVLEGFAPLTPHPGIGVNSDQHEQIPPLDQRKGSYYYGVKHWFESSYAGTLMKVVCFACGAIWSGTWRDIVERTSEGLRDAQKSYLIPRISGSGMITLIDQPAKACPCNVGLYLWNKKAPTATPEEVQRSLEIDVHQCEEGARAIEANGGNVRNIISKVIEDQMAKREAVGMRDPAIRVAGGTDPERVYSKVETLKSEPGEVFVAEEEPPPHTDDDEYI